MVNKKLGERTPVNIEYSEPDNTLNPLDDLQNGFTEMGFDKVPEGIQSGDYATGSSGWRISKDGTAEFVNLIISGYIAVGGALADVGAGNITGTYISNGAITTAKLTATAIDGMTITGALIRTSASGDRVEIDDVKNSLDVYDTVSNLRVQLDNDELIFYNTGGTSVGTLRAATTNFFIASSNNMDISAINVLYISGQGTGLTLDSSGISMGNHVNMLGNDIKDVDRISGTSGYIDYSAGGQIYTNARFAPITDNTYDLGAINKIWNDIYVSDVNYSTLTLISDRKLKDNIVKLPSSLDKILSLKPVSFNYKKKKVTVKKDKRVSPSKTIEEQKRVNKNLKKYSDIKHLGFIAQDVQKVFPELVRKREDDILTLSSTELIPVLVKAIQELKVEVDSLKK